jgi:sulfite reductase (NADPH) hemoprotein beta-component
MLGADRHGQRLNTLYRENIAEPEILAALDPLLARYAAEAEHGLGFGDFLVRSNVLSISAAVTSPTGIPLVLRT